MGYVPSNKSGGPFVHMKKITKFLRFLALVFFAFLAVVTCFVFNKLLDQKIEEQHQQAIESLSNYNNK